MNYIEALQKRYSVKKFNSKKIPNEIIKNILEAGKLSASSLGLQPYRIYIIENKDTLKSVQPAFYNPSQVSTCSHLFLLAAKKSISDSYIKGYINHISEVRNIPFDSLSSFQKNIISFSENLQNKVFDWTSNQCYIVLGNLMFAAALENIDTCPMEGFSSEKIGEILKLDSTEEEICVALALGYRAEDDNFQNLKKVRKLDEKIFKYI